MDDTRSTIAISADEDWCEAVFSGKERDLLFWENTLLNTFLALIQDPEDKSDPILANEVQKILDNIGKEEK